MLCTLHLPFTLMQNLLQMSHGLSRLMISFRMLSLMFIICTISQLLWFCSFQKKNDCISLIRYADNQNAYWTGYFTSRPALKQYVRMMSGYYLVVLSPLSIWCPLDVQKTI
jgi:hypothetical protein